MSRVRPTSPVDLTERLQQVAAYAESLARPDLRERGSRDDLVDGSVADALEATDVPVLRIPVPRRDRRYYSRRTGSSRAFTELEFAD